TTISPGESIHGPLAPSTFQLGNQETLTMWGSPTRSVRKLTTSPVRLVGAGSSPGRSSRSRGRVVSGSGPDLAKAAAAAGSLPEAKASGVSSHPGRADQESAGGRQSGGA